MMWLTWVIPLVIVTFLWTLNDFLRGRGKELISGVLALLTFALCGVAFIVSGWLVGLIALVSSFVLGALFRYPALLIAKRLIKYPDHGADDYSQRRLARTLKDFGSPQHFERRETEEREEAHHLTQTVDQAMSQPDVQEVLRELSCRKEDIEAFYQRFEILSLPPKARELAVCNASMLAYFLTNSVKGEVAGEYVRNFRDQDVTMTLTLWAKHNPSGRSPG